MIMMIASETSIHKSSNKDIQQREPPPQTKNPETNPQKRLEMLKLQKNMK